MKHKRIPVPNPVAVLREESDEWAVLFDPDAPETAGVNPIGVAIWKLIDGKRSVDDIVAKIGTRFRDVPGSVSEDVCEFVDRLAESGFVGYEMESTDDAPSETGGNGEETDS